MSVEQRGSTTIASQEINRREFLKFSGVTAGSLVLDKVTLPGVGREIERVASPEKEQVVENIGMIEHIWVAGQEIFCTTRAIFQHDHVSGLWKADFEEGRLQFIKMDLPEIEIDGEMVDLEEEGIYTWGFTELSEGNFLVLAGNGRGGLLFHYSQEKGWSYIEREPGTLMNAAGEIEVNVSNPDEVIVADNVLNEDIEFIGSMGKGVLERENNTVRWESIYDGDDMSGAVSLVQLANGDLVITGWGGNHPGNGIWKRKSGEWSNPYDFVMKPMEIMATPDKALVVTFSDSYIFYSEDQGENWNDFYIPGLWEDNRIRAMELLGDREFIFVSDQFLGSWDEEDGEEILEENIHYWEDLPGLPENFEPKALEVNPDDTNEILMAIKYLGVGPDEYKYGFYRSTDGGQTWEKVTFVEIVEKEPEEKIYLPFVGRDF